MFFKLVFQNAKRSRQENFIYFCTLVVAAASFYIILSLDQQDVITFLKTFESDAINKLFALMPIVYVIALFLVGFLALFANRYQLDRRSREFGLYLMLGMPKRRLFLLLLAEGLVTSLVALVAGLLSGGILAELISLVSSRLVGQGIIGHAFSFSLPAAGFTALGFLLAQGVVLLLLGARLFRSDLHKLLYGSVEQKQAKGSRKGSVLSLLGGVVLLGLAYWLALGYFQVLAGIPLLLATFLLILGTPLLIRGLARLLSRAATSSKKGQTKGLWTFTLRQFQENLANKATSVAAASILTTLALIFIAAGASVMLTRGGTTSDVVYHFTVRGDVQEVEELLTSPAMQPYVADLNLLEMGYMGGEQIGSGDQSIIRSQLDWSVLREKLVAALPVGTYVPELDLGQGYSIAGDSPWLLRLVQRLDGDMLHPTLIAESSYSRLLQTAGEEPLNLQANELAFYLNPRFFPMDDPQTAALFDSITQDPTTASDALLVLEDQPLRIAPLPPMYGLVTDSTITQVFALIVPDALYETLVDPSNSELYWNFRIPADLEQAEGLMVPISEASELLAGSGLEFESYLQNFGRQLFYVVAGSYTLLYTGFIFLIIGCTVLALQFLMQMRQTKLRYLTLSLLGAEQSQMKRSMRQQIAAQFLLPLGLACISGIFGLKAMTSFFVIHIDDSGLLFPVALAFVCVIILVEVLYAVAVARTAEHDLDKLAYKA
jgi:putative ABC transport system permease protein